ncbi:hypothetical protein Acsp06_58570 [Actinomycetospora sp. NBRC 106375]|uniref:alpha/beta fold hydrolase n=1 Tax=Actinomycetospora sp. NBRC 106375 TaxID=3032207 RepID=UPI0024A1F512|nr:alpha/beta fold hydrolase [Actinomycetospora sp. NBRC 106375]GLZ49672.1 hypothetical protein Acsp06_58570 [Actinomycetospora sp. NBRC 106375]
MVEVSVVGPDDGEITLTSPVRMRILEDGRTTDHRLGLGEITVAPHTDGPAQHRHAQHDEGFYVVSGTARFTVGETSVDAGPRTLVMVPTGAPHTFANPGDEPAVILNTFTPDLYVQYFRDLRSMIEGGQELSGDAVAGVMARYATEPATSYAAGPSSEVVLSDGLALGVDDRGTGRPVLVLHGGGGPASVAGMSAMLADLGLRVLTPTIPGFEGTDRPAGLDSVPDLARTYRRLLDDLGLSDVTVVGSSVGGWVAAQMALEERAHGTRRVRDVVLINAVGIDVPGHPITDVSAVPLDRLADLSYHDPDRFRVDPALFSEERRAAMADDAAVFATYAGDPYMHDPALLGRLPEVGVPALVVWGESDGIVDVDYGRAYAAALGAEFVTVPEAGHLPFVERPDAMREVLAPVLR